MGRKNTQIKKKCKTCGKEFHVVTCRKDTAKFCSPSCRRFTSATKKLWSRQRKGIPKTAEWKKVMAISKMSENNPNWKGDGVGLDALHIWVLRRKPKPELCEMCKKSPPKDLANISQKYLRSVDDFEWLCRKCHMTKDGRLNKLRSMRIKILVP